MDFALNETQRTVAAVAAETLAREPAESAWKAMSRAGLLALAIPERLGGEGLGVVEIAVLLTEVGRAAAPLPALHTLALGVLPIVTLGTEPQQDELLSEVGSGDRVLTAALREPADVTSTMDNGLLSGVKVGVGYAAAAHRILVPAGGEVLVVDPHAPGVSLTPTPTSSGTPEYTVRFDRVRADRLGGPGAADELERLAIAGACATGDGLLAGALDLTAAYVRTREQFGRPLATFQAVAQQIADIYIAARTLHLTTVTACWQLAQHHTVVHRRPGYPQPPHNHATPSPPADRMAVRDAPGSGGGCTSEGDGGHDVGGGADAELGVAAYWVAEEVPRAVQVCHHLHGGLGVDVGYPLHRYYSAAKDLVRFLGGVEQCLERLCASS